MSFVTGFGNDTLSGPDFPECSVRRITISWVFGIKSSQLGGVAASECECVDGAAGKISERVGKEYFKRASYRGSKATRSC
jgi:hypothetical protein